MEATRIIAGLTLIVTAITSAAVLGVAYLPKNMRLRDLCKYIMAIGGGLIISLGIAAGVNLLIGI